MERSDYIVDTQFDRLVVAKPYFTAEALQILRMEKVIKLQAFIRGCFARQRASKMRKEQAALQDEVQTTHVRLKMEHEANVALELQRRLHPRTKRDFALLYDELEAWRQQESARIDEAEIPPHERQLALQELLRKESKLLQKIDQLKAQANREHHMEKIDVMMHTMKRCKQWKGVDIETPSTVRARELSTLYEALVQTRTPLDERLALLLQVKTTVQACPSSALTKEIIMLLDREADLLGRGRKASTLDGLRRRVSNLFLQFLEDPLYRP